MGNGEGGRLAVVLGSDQTDMEKSHENQRLIESGGRVFWWVFWWVWVGWVWSVTCC